MSSDVVVHKLVVQYSQYVHERLLRTKLRKRVFETMPSLSSLWGKRVKVSDPERILLGDHVNKKKALVCELACLNMGTPVTELKKYSEAYFSLLDATLDRISTTVLEVIYTESPNPSNTDKRLRLYEIMHVMVTTFRNEPKEVFIHRLSLDLAEKGLVRREDDKVAQLIFLLFGAFTMLYVPRLDPEKGKLQMHDANKSADGSLLGIQRRDTATWHNRSQDLVHLVNEETSFHDLLFRCCNHKDGPIPPPGARRPSDSDRRGFGYRSRDLHSENVAFYTLHALLKIEIQWTKSICEHLEFNTRTRRLKLFQFPSYCVLLCLLKPDETYLNNFFHRFSEVPHSEARPKVSAAEFFREVISSYRLIFGQHKDSRERIKAISGRKWMARLPKFSKKPRVSALPTEDADPLLATLCFKDSRHEPLFDDLGLFSLKKVYDLNVDFPHFADRLEELQIFVEDQCENDWKVLWRDRRDLAKFWTFWAVLLIGVPSVVLSFIQLLLMGLQLRGSSTS